MNRIILVLFAFYTLNSCSDSKNKTQEKAVPKVEAVQQLQALNNDFALEYLQPVDYIDIVLYEKGFSMNISQPSSIQSLFGGLTTQAPVPDATCPAQGRIFFNSKGKTMTEADLHFIPNQCAILVFYVNGKKKFASQMNETGIGIFNNYFTNASQMQNQMQQGQ